jgi:CheY-like chemotaxis protein
MSRVILVVDDEDMIRSIVRLYLEHGGYQVIQAANGPEAIEKYRTEKPDLVVTDIAMPDMSGFDVAKQIRAIQQSENRPRIPIIMLTAYARSFFTSTADAEAGIDSFLTKPISPEQLLSCVKRFLGAQAS